MSLTIASNDNEKLVANAQAELHISESLESHGIIQVLSRTERLREDICIAFCLSFTVSFNKSEVHKDSKA